MSSRPAVVVAVVAAVAVVPVVAALAGCSHREKDDAARAAEVHDDVVTWGPRTRLPPPEQKTVPTVEVVTAVGWQAGQQPVVADGLAVTAYADHLDHPRWLSVLPNGDVLVAETNAPDRPEDKKGIKGRLMGVFMKKAGGAPPSANRITLLRDLDGDGVAETRTPFLTGLNSPFGMALVGDRFYVANTDSVVRYFYREGDTQIQANPEIVTRLPAGPRNHHWTKSLIASPDGAHLYVGVGSNSNAAEHGLGEEVDRAAIWEIDTATGDHRIFADGLRNPVGLAFVPETGALWTAVNERDELGGDLVPDYMTSVQRGGFYGWPWTYFGDHLDPRVTPRRVDKEQQALVPDYALGAHTASLGLAWSPAAPKTTKNATKSTTTSTTQVTLPPAWQHGMFVGQHGSWNRTPRAGYQVVFVPFDDAGHATGDARTVVAGFVDKDGNARGRPVGVAVGTDGALYVADDVGNAVWRVAAAAPARVSVSSPARRGSTGR